jgi:hypothetical protein
MTAVVLMAISGIGSIVGIQGYRSSVPGVDMVPYHLAAEDLLQHGRIPDHGDLNSFAAFNPPGVVWPMALGLGLTRDIQTAELPGALIFYWLAIAGVYCMGKRLGGRGVGLLAAVVYALSARSLLAAGRLQPMFQSPCFLIWIFLGLDHWVRRRAAMGLTVAALLWGVSLWIFPSLLPAVLLPVILWLMYRPPVRWSHLAIVGALVMLLFASFIRFEAGRGFRDVRATLAQHSLVEGPVVPAWCDSQLTVYTGSNSSSQLTPAALTSDGASSQSLNRRVLGRLGAATRVLFENYFTNGWSILAGLAMLASTLWLFSQVCLRRTRWPRLLAGLLLRHVVWRRIAGTVLCLLAVAANPPVVARLLGPGPAITPQARINILLLEAVTLALGLAMLWPWRGLAPRERRLFPSVSLEDWHPFAVMTVAFWVSMMLLAAPGRGDRVWQLWPAHVVLLALVAVAWPLRLGSTQAHRTAAWLGGAVLLACIVPNLYLRNHVGALVREGLAGKASPQTQLLDALAGELAKQGRTKAALGVQSFFKSFELDNLQADPQLTLGLVNSLYLRHRRGISAEPTCPEGFSPGDEWRLVETRRSTDPQANLILSRRAAIPPWGEIVATAGSWRLEHHPVNTTD